MDNHASKLTVRLPLELHRRAKAQAARTGETLGEVVRAALRWYILRREEQEWRLAEQIRSALDGALDREKLLMGEAYADLRAELAAAAASEVARFLDRLREPPEFQDPDEDEDDEDEAVLQMQNTFQCHASN